MQTATFTTLTAAACLATLPIAATAATTDAQTVRDITAAVTKCAHHNDYTGPVRVIRITSVNPDYAVATLLLGISGDSAAKIVVKRTGHTWTCTAGDGGALNASELQRAGVPPKVGRSILTGAGTRQLLKTPAPAPTPRASKTPNDSDADRLFGSPTPAPRPPSS
jgi:hypothetical protein